MTRLTSILWSVVALLLICLGTSWAIQRRSVAKAEAAESRAQVLGVERDKALGDAKVSQDRADAEAQARTKAEGSLKQARADVADARARLKAPGQSVPAVPGDGPVVAPDAKDDLIAAQDDLIAKQDLKIGSLEREVVDLRTLNETKNVAISLGKQRERALEIALDAQKRATSSSKWMGRLQGFAIGVSVGYVGGKL